MRIDFNCHADRFAWISIDKKTVIRPVGTRLCFPLVKAEGIPIAPDRHYFKSPNDILHYSLYFYSIPPDVKCFDILEKRGQWERYYINFYGVKIQRTKNILKVSEN